MGRARPAVQYHAVITFKASTREDRSDDHNSSTPGVKLLVNRFTAYCKIQLYYQVIYRERSLFIPGIFVHIIDNGQKKSISRKI